MLQYELWRPVFLDYLNSDINIKIEPVSRDALPDILSPTLLPIHMLDHQQAFKLTITKNKISKYFVYILSKGVAYCQLNRQFLPYIEHLNDILVYMKKYHSSIDSLQLSRVIADEKRFNWPGDVQASGQTFILRLANDVNFYLKSIIALSLKNELLYKERKFERRHGKIRYIVYGKNWSMPITADILKTATTVIDDHMEAKAHKTGQQYVRAYNDEWLEKNYKTYSDMGAIVICYADDTPIVSYLGLYSNNIFYYIGSGYTDGAHAKLSISKIIFLKLIEELYAAGCQEMMLGGGDFGFKTKFGANEYTYYTGRLRLDDELAIDDFLVSKTRFSDINNFFDSNFTDRIFSEDDILPLPNRDFNCQPKIKGWKGYFRTVSYAVFSLLYSLNIDLRSISFFNINTGLGFIDLCLSCFPFKKRGGLFLEQEIYDFFKHTCSIINFNDFNALISPDLSFSAEKIESFNVFFAHNPCDELLFRVICQRVVQSWESNPRDIYFISLFNIYSNILKEFGFVLLQEKFPQTIEWRFTSPAAIYKLPHPDHRPG